MEPDAWLTQPDRSSPRVHLNRRTITGTTEGAP